MPEMDQIDVAQQEREVFDWLTARIQMLESGDSSDANKQELAFLRILKGTIELRSAASDDASLTDLSIFYWLADRFKLIQHYKLEIKRCILLLTNFKQWLSNLSSLDITIPLKKVEEALQLWQSGNDFFDDGTKSLTTLAMCQLYKQSEEPLNENLMKEMVSIDADDIPQDATFLAILSFEFSRRHIPTWWCNDARLLFSKLFQMRAFIYNSFLDVLCESFPTFASALKTYDQSYKIDFRDYPSHPAAHSALDSSSSASLPPEYTPLPSAPPASAPLPSVGEQQATLFGGREPLGLGQELGLYDSTRSIRGPGGTGPS